MTHGTVEAVILIVETDADLARLLEQQLGSAGYRTVRATAVDETLQRAHTHRPHLVLLDLDRPDGMGEQICRRLKSNPPTAHVGVVILSRRATDADRVAGLEAGADEYVIKPFSFSELILRLGAVQRRVSSPWPATAQRRRCGVIELDPMAFGARVDGKAVPVSLMEFRLLQLLMETQGRVATREELIMAAWGERQRADVAKLKTHIRRLRLKLGAAGSAIEAVRSIGYRLRSDR